MSNEPKSEHIEVDSSKSRAESAIADIAGLERVLTPPRSLIRVLDGMEGAKCGQKYSLIWNEGPQKGMPVTGYCAEPLCITEGACTGPRFVPHVDQYTSDESGSPLRQRRKLLKNEAVAASKQFALRSSKETGRPEDRSDREIWEHIKIVWTKILTSIRGPGDWKS